MKMLILGSEQRSKSTDLDYEETMAMMTPVLATFEDDRLDMRKFMLEYLNTRDWAQWIPHGRTLAEHTFKRVWRELFAEATRQK